MEGHQLSHDEYKKCVNACVKVAIFGRPSDDDTKPGDEGYDEGFDETDDVTDGDLGEVEQHGVSCFAESIAVDAANNITTSDTQDEVRDNKHDEKYREEGTGFSRRLKQGNAAEIEKCGTVTKQEYKEESSDDEIDHGSGFIIDDKLIITNMHVIKDCLYDETKKIRISNAAIGELSCQVVNYCASNDLGLLYCRDLDLKQNGICPLQLSEEALLPSTSICTFGYPLTHTGETALYVRGYVSGSVDRYGREPLIVLNCPVNHGNSGGPVIC